MTNRYLCFLPAFQSAFYASGYLNSFTRLPVPPFVKLSICLLRIWLLKPRYQKGNRGRDRYFQSAFYASGYLNGHIMWPGNRCISRLSICLLRIWLLKRPFYVRRRGTLANFQSAFYASGYLNECPLIGPYPLPTLSICLLRIWLLKQRSSGHGQMTTYRLSICLLRIWLLKRPDEMLVYGLFIAFNLPFTHLAT